MRLISGRRLWVGHAGDLRDIGLLHAAGVEAVVELADNDPPAVLPRSLVHARFPLADGAGNPDWLLGLAADAVARLVAAGVPTLVACSAGTSRSVAVAAAGLARADRIELAAALALVTAAGPADVSSGLWAAVSRLPGDAARPASSAHTVYG